MDNKYRDGVQSWQFPIILSDTIFFLSFLFQSILRNAQHSTKEQDGRRFVHGTVVT